MYKSRSYILFIFFLFLLSVNSVPIENGVIGDPKIECMGDQIAISFTTQKAFAGRVYVKGFSAQRECVAAGADRPPIINLSFSQCGVQRNRQLNPPGMIVYTTVVISFHPIFITKVDRAYRIACYYLEATKTVTADLDVSMISTGAITIYPTMPECKYEILLGGPAGTPVRYAKVGEQVYHKWTCDAKSDVYCMRVHSCSVDDGQGSEPYMVINKLGCATDRFILQNLEYLSDLMAGQEAHVVKFADKTSLFFSCQIELLSKASDIATCVSARPNCNNTAGTLATAKEYQSVVLPAPATFNESAKRRSARDNRFALSKAQITDKNDFHVVGDMDLPRQRLTVFDLDEAPDESASKNHSTSTAAFKSSTQLPQSDFYPSKLIDNYGVAGPICISPLGFGLSLLAILTIFVIALTAAIRFAFPVHQLNYNHRVSPAYQLQRLNHQFPFREK